VTTAPRRQGILFVISGPSGAGKSTLLDGLRRTSDFVYSVSCTTRAPRAGEQDGADYHFMSEEEFQRRVDNGEFIEHASVHGAHYGTLREKVMQHLDQGVDVLLDIDTQGADMIRHHADGALLGYLADVFIMPVSVGELRRRLLGRATETEEQLQVRLTNATREMRQWREYRYVILSKSIEDDLENFRAIMRAERQLAKRLTLEIP
jgi:guanylate kinase